MVRRFAAPDAESIVAGRLYGPQGLGLLTSSPKSGSTSRAKYLRTGWLEKWADVSQKLSQKQLWPIHHHEMVTALEPNKRPVRRRDHFEILLAKPLRARRRADRQRRVPQPTSRPEAAIQHSSLSAIRIGANAIASTHEGHSRIITPTLSGPQPRTQSLPPSALLVTPRIELRAMAQAGGVVPSLEKL
jgi:hypothetical protein